MYQTQETFDGILRINKKISFPRFLDSINIRTDIQWVKVSAQMALILCFIAVQGDFNIIKGNMTYMWPLASKVQFFVIL